MKKKNLFLLLTCVFALHAINPVFSMKSEKDEEEEDVSHTSHFALNNNNNHNVDGFVSFPDNLSALQEAQQRLHQEILRSLGAQPDRWSEPLHTIKQAFQQAPIEVQNTVRQHFSNLIDPTLSLWPPHLLNQDKDLPHKQSSLNPEETPAFGRLLVVGEKLRRLQQEAPDFSSHFQRLQWIYEEYIRILCQESFDQRRFFLAPICMKTEFSDETYLISQETSNRLLSVGSYGILKKYNDTGSSIVTHIGSIYAKQNCIIRKEREPLKNTLNPPMEWAISTFHRLLFENDGFISSATLNLINVPLSESAKIAKRREDLLAETRSHRVGGKDRDDIHRRLREDLTLKPTQSYLLQVTSLVQGELLGSFLKRASNEKLGKVDLASTQELILSSLLTTPSDGKEDNLMVIKDRAGGKKIVSIDNDLALAPFIIQEKTEYHALEARNILWAVQQFMDTPLQESVRKRFLSHDPTKFLQAWVQALNIHQERYQKVFDPCFVHELLTLHFQEGALQTILKNFQTLQKCIQQSSTITCQELFETLSPIAAQVYKILRNKYLSLETFDLIYRQDPSLEEILEAQEKRAPSSPHDWRKTQALLERERMSKNDYTRRTQTIEDAAFELRNKRVSPSHALSAEKGGKDTSPPSQKNLLLSVEEALEETTPLLFLQKRDSREGQLLTVNQEDDVEMRVLSGPSEVNMQDAHGWTSLHYAVLQGDLETAAQLLNQGTNLEQRTRRGMTALHASLYTQNRAMCQLLLRKGASLETLDEEGRDALSIARDRDCENIIQDELRRRRIKKYLKWGSIGGGTLTGCAAITIGIPCGFLFWPEEKCAAEISLASLNGKNGFNLTSVLPSAQLGSAVSNAGDVNGDHITDFLISAPYASLPPVYQAGIVYVVFGRNGSWPATISLGSLNGGNGSALNGFEAGGQAGSSASGVGDVNGDNIDDIIIGAFGINNLTGAAYVVFGQRGGWPAAFSLNNLNGTNGFSLVGVAPSSYTGYSVSGAGDINDDGIVDIIIGAPLAFATHSGVSYVVFGHSGSWPAAFNLSSLDGTNGFNLRNSVGGEVGYGVSSAGDINGDSIDDLAIGASFAHNYIGACYVVFGHGGKWPATLNLSSLDGADGFNLTGVVATTDTGFVVGNAGDINGDGVNDLAVGALMNGGNSGFGYVVFGHNGTWPSTISLGSLNGVNGFNLTSIAANAQTDFDMSTAGDVNNDGIDDLLIGTPSFDDNAGASYVILGHKEAWPSTIFLNNLNGANGFRLTSVSSSALTGSSVSNAGDVNNDSIADIIIGASGYGDISSGVIGAGYVVFGQNQCEFAHTNRFKEWKFLSHEATSSASPLEPLWITPFRTAFQAIASTPSFLWTTGSDTATDLPETSSSTLSSRMNAHTSSFLNLTYFSGQVAFSQVASHLAHQVYDGFSRWWHNKPPVNYNAPLAEYVPSMAVKKDLQDHVKTLKQLKGTLQQFETQTPSAQHFTSWLVEVISGYQAEGERLLRQSSVNRDALQALTENVAAITEDVGVLLKKLAKKHERNRL